ncbi:hypothetical protein L1887_51530 [Cichorium endivia]|nr:hypothetical protein L1887_51530 [Cichorium endivia]
MSEEECMECMPWSVDFAARCRSSDRCREAKLARGRPRVAFATMPVVDALKRDGAVAVRARSSTPTCTRMVQQPVASQSADSRASAHCIHDQEANTLAHCSTTCTAQNTESRQIRLETPFRVVLLASRGEDPDGAASSCCSLLSLDGGLKSAKLLCCNCKRGCR